MTIDPKLLALFTEAQQVFDQDAFAREVLARIDAERRRTVLLWAGLGFIALVALALLAAPPQRTRLSLHEYPTLLTVYSTNSDSSQRTPLVEVSPSVHPTG